MAGRALVGRGNRRPGSAAQIQQSARPLCATTRSIAAAPRRPPADGITGIPRPALRHPPPHAPPLAPPTPAQPPPPGGHPACDQANGELCEKSVCCDSRSRRAFFSPSTPRPYFGPRGTAPRPATVAAGCRRVGIRTEIVDQVFLWPISASRARPCARITLGDLTRAPSRTPIWMCPLGWDHCGEL